MISMAVISSANEAKAGSFLSMRAPALTRAYAGGWSLRWCAFFREKRKVAVTPVISGDPVVFSTRAGAAKTENVVFVMEGGLQENGPPL